MTAVRPPGEVVAAAEIAHDDWIWHPDHGPVRVAGIVPWLARNGTEAGTCMRSLVLCRPDGSLLEHPYEVTAAETVVRVPPPSRQCPVCLKPERWSTSYATPRWVHASAADLMACGPAEVTR